MNKTNGTKQMEQNKWNKTNGTKQMTPITINIQAEENNKTNDTHHY
ncbi:hypothetical protein PPIS_a1425 [Pseudoalteromonas piscicida]|uniref:Uncharacterized protein n=1 Tax=Pseudoalteromonas piscicida TaxID=43662 RepID=A0ABM6NCD6_PSEO7|nr:hypothetical protein PPIS_a1425 [Pseudoalteromonas piscicida]